MGFETSGRIHALSDTKQVTERFRKREFVVQIGDNSRFPQFVQFELTGDRCEQLDDYKVGEEVRVEFSLRGREWKSPKGETKYFNSLDVWTLQRVGDRGDQRGAFSEDEPPPPSDDDVPF
jgi:Domain of unknown function (DUF3127)